MDIQRDNFFPGRIYEPDFMQGKLYGRPHRYPKLENKQRLNLPAMPHSRFNKIPDRTHYRNDMQFGDGSDWATFPVMKLTNHGWVCDYDGVAMYGDCGNHASLDIIDVITIKARVKPVATGIETSIFIRGEHNVNGYYVRISATVKIQLTCNQLGTSQHTFSSAGDIIAGNEYYIVAVREGSVGKLYKNGVDVTVDQPAILGITSSDKTAKIGVYESMVSYFNGTIALVIIKALAESAAKQKDDYWRQA